MQLAHPTMCTESMGGHPGGCRLPKLGRQLDVAGIQHCPRWCCTRRASTRCQACGTASRSWRDSTPGWACCTGRRPARRCWTACASSPRTATRCRSGSDAAFSNLPAVLCQQHQIALCVKMQAGQRASHVLKARQLSSARCATVHEACRGLWTALQDGWTTPSSDVYQIVHTGLPVHRG